MGHRVELPERKRVRGCYLSLWPRLSLSFIYHRKKNPSSFRLHSCKIHCTVCHWGCECQLNAYNPWGSKNQCFVLWRVIIRGRLENQNPAALTGPVNWTTEAHPASCCLDRWLHYNWLINKPVWVTGSPIHNFQLSRLLILGQKFWSLRLTTCLCLSIYFTFQYYLTVWEGL